MKFSLFVAILMLVSSTCFAITPRVQFGEAWGVSIPNGSLDVSAPPPSTLFGLGASTAINDRWNMFTDLVLMVPRTKFYPGIRPVVGVAHKFDGWAVAGTLLYQWNPPYATGLKPVHTVGPTFAVIFPLAANGISFSFGLGYRAQFTGDKIFHVLSCGPGLFYAF